MLDQLFIVGELNEEKIRAAPAALSELRRLQEISFNRNPTPWHKRNSEAIKIASVNCCGLLSHLRDIRKDFKLQKGDVLHILETSLPQDIDQDDITIHGYRGSLINVGNGKGIGTFVKEGIATGQSQDIVKQTLQITKFNIAGIDTISVYRSSNHSVKEVAETLDSLIDVGNPTIITGDINICLKKNGKNAITASLMKKGFQSMIQRPTQIQGGYIDHIYWLDRDCRYNQPTVEFYSPYWSDHDALLVTITERY